ncbi:gamma-aminobutyric acid receptor subunit gamma-3-like [Rana temporaria]|uniref:gamma-aminobutyric acid receptor subunit gamma-3-like n=1 Tax=Rana temporaria TaxID=8407 RepID=UPI001AADC6E7|nr:gamma-aminobutyric acid receptor subunit gamma-3-like [Rana temporaria]
MATLLAVMSTKLLVLFLLLTVFQACSRKIDDDEYEDLTINQKWVLAPKTQDTDATLILNKLLKEYDKKLRPDIGVKPTIIDVDIYVNSIGPVSSINMQNIYHKPPTILHILGDFIQLFGLFSSDLLFNSKLKEAAISED